MRVIARGRPRSRGSDLDLGVRAWTAIIDRHWIIVDRFDADGLRWLVVRDNPLGEMDLPALGRTEQGVLHAAVDGFADRDIAESLGITRSGVSRALATALRKLGGVDLGLLALLHHQSAAGSLVALPVAVDGLRALGMCAAGVSDVAGLTAAEREIVPLLLTGHTNRQLGQLRGTSERTIANQVRSVFDKLGVGSRRELVRWFAMTRAG
jgi:DNA-binding CsgD family transcriptional regulator